MLMICRETLRIVVRAILHKFSLSDLSCGGCKYCQRALERWNDFSPENVDVIPLAQMFAEGSTAD